MKKVTLTSVILLAVTSALFALAFRAESHGSNGLAFFAILFALFTSLALCLDVSA